MLPDSSKTRVKRCAGAVFNIHGRGRDFRREIDIADVAATVEAFEAIGDPEKFKAFVNAAEGEKTKRERDNSARAPRFSLRAIRLTRGSALRPLTE